ncbi:hypothetical protein J8273_8142 [Carpediemonas membranifera]|uniref:Uncharacterized protein n=1 Tax=Carpediemonas membranifera TaxID=201153 RepID=A0A8J6AS47_9EUKA|nr:hypothetical protein J8273_8142 [Carpediemonas membranifera]|eukprot:KAG9390105.1 hypothetical protein J8273_8142 [Carpediemonas membranifera]
MELGASPESTAEFDRRVATLDKLQKARDILSVAKATQLQMEPPSPRTVGTEELVFDQLSGNEAMEIKKLRHQLSALQQRFESQVRTTNVLQVQISDERKKNQVANETINEYKDRLAHLDIETRSLREELEDATISVERRIARETRPLQDAVAELKASLADRNDQVMMLTQQTESRLSRVKTTSDKELLEMQGAYHSLRREYDSLKGINKELRTQADRLRREKEADVDAQAVLGLRVELTAAQGQLEDYQEMAKRLVELEAENTSLQADVDVLSSEIGDKQAELDLVVAMLESDTKALHERGETLSSPTEEVSDLLARLDSKQGELSAMADKVEAADAARRRAELRLALLRESQTAEEVERLKSELSAANETIAVQLEEMGRLLHSGPMRAPATDAQGGAAPETAVDGGSEAEEGDAFIADLKAEIAHLKKVIEDQNLGDAEATEEAIAQKEEAMEELKAAYEEIKVLENKIDAGSGGLLTQLKNAMTELDEAERARRLEQHRAAEQNAELYAQLESTRKALAARSADTESDLLKKARDEKIMLEGALNSVACSAREHLDVLMSDVDCQANILGNIGAMVREVLAEVQGLRE